jgi:hypothetical protein
MDEPKELTRTDYKIQCTFTCMYIVDPTLSGFLGSHAELVIPDGYGYVDSALYIYTYMYTYLYIIHMYIFIHRERMPHFNGRLILLCAQIFGRPFCPGGCHKGALEPGWTHIWFSRSAQ